MRLATNFAIHFVALAVLWMLLTGARFDSWIIGGPTVVVAAATAVLLSPRPTWRWSAAGMLRFGPHFVISSIQGGIDVAWRSLHPQLPIHPALIEYQLRLPAGAARIFFICIVSLLPGTVSADVRGDRLQVHVLDCRRPIQQRLAKLERVVAGLFATHIAPDEAQPGDHS
jgi:multicomponent Na+:H+ antiporter subunit E